MSLSIPSSVVSLTGGAETAGSKFIKSEHDSGDAFIFPGVWMGEKQGTYTHTHPLFECFSQMCASFLTEIIEQSGSLMSSLSLALGFYVFLMETLNLESERVRKYLTGQTLPLISPAKSKLLCVSPICTYLDLWCTQLALLLYQHLWGLRAGAGVGRAYFIGRLGHLGLQNSQSRLLFLSGIETLVIRFLWLRHFWGPGYKKLFPLKSGQKCVRALWWVTLLREDTRDGKGNDKTSHPLPKLSADGIQQKIFTTGWCWGASCRNGPLLLGCGF